MSERTGFVVHESCQDASAALVAAAFNMPGWDDFLLEYSTVDGPSWIAAEEAARRAGFHTRSIDPLVAYHVTLNEGYADLLRRLSSGVRRSVFNKRRKLEAYGAVSWEESTPETADEFWADLDRLHALRWGWRATEGLRGQFYRAYCDSQWPAGSVFLRRLRVGGRTIAAMHAYRHGDRIYEIQSAIDAGFSRSISAGYLSVGYLLEEAAALGVQTVDFLGGSGRQTDYKAQLGTVATRLGCLQVIRSPWLAGMYRVRDLMRDASPG
jgi:CelD/BcsL family acetyltransferase involved in cellulose biosynthesis